MLTVEIYSHTVNIGKISICLNRGREESVGNDDVSIVCARKYEMVRMTLRQNIPKGQLRYPGYHRFFSRAVGIFGVGQRPTQTTLEKSLAPRVPLR